MEQHWELPDNVVRSQHIVVSLLLISSLFWHIKILELHILYSLKRMITNDCSVWKRSLKNYFEKKFKSLIFLISENVGRFNSSYRAYKSFPYIALTFLVPCNLQFGCLVSHSQPKLFYIKMPVLSSAINSITVNKNSQYYWMYTICHILF